MSIVHTYCDFARPNDSGDGLSWATAKKTKAAAATLAEGSGADVHAHFRGHFRIPSGGTAESNNFEPDASFASITVEGEDGATDFYATRFEHADAGWSVVSGNTRKIALVKPTGLNTADPRVPATLDIETCYLDWENEEDYLDADGRPQIGLTAASSQANCEATPYTYWWAANEYFVNRGAVNGSVEVFWRQAGSNNMWAVRGTNQTWRGFETHQPFYMATGKDNYCHALYVGASADHNITIEDWFYRGVAWHAMAVLGDGGVLLLKNVHLNNVRARAAIVSDLLAPSLIFFGFFTATHTGNLVIEDFGSADVTYECFRPRRHDGTELPAGTGGAVGNNFAAGMVAHGLGEVFPDPPLTVELANCTEQLRTIVKLWDYRFQDPFLMQDNTQAFTDADYSDAAWESWAEDLEIRRMLPYSAPLAATEYGAWSVSSNKNLRVKRGVFKWPDAAVFSATPGTQMLKIEGQHGRTTVWELEEPKWMLEGNSIARFCRMWMNWGNGGSGTAIVKFRQRHPTAVCEAGPGEMLEQICLFDTESPGTLQSTIQVDQPIFHSNDTTNPGRWRMMYDATLSDLPASRLIFRNGWYSNFAADGFDLSGGSTRRSATQWRDDATGPLEKTLAGSGGTRDARYDSAGVWDSDAEDFTVDSPAYDEGIDEGVTLSSVPTIGVNGELFSRLRGAIQRGGLPPDPEPEPSNTAVVPRPNAIEARGIRNRGR